MTRRMDDFLQVLMNAVLRLRGLTQTSRDNGCVADDAGLLKRVIRYYFATGDFNGLYLDANSDDLMQSAIGLTRRGLLQVVSEEDYPNPHIRPWPYRRSISQQVASIEALSAGGYGLCLYPTPQALRSQRVPQRFAGQPYRHAMAKGRGSLELAYFSFEVLEVYRNDPRFSFDFYDFGAYASISDDAYLDDSEPEHDKTGMRHIGFAYDLSGYSSDDPDSIVVRRVCAFYGDLADLTLVHQQRWKTYQVEEHNLKPHPVWWRSQMGHFPDGIGPFERFFAELRALSELNERAFGRPLFRSTERPRDFGWILRPSQREWDDFIRELDKLLSENIRHDTLDVMAVARVNDRGENIGTLNRLEVLLRSHGIPEDAAKDVMRPFREVRQARQRPAHALRANLTDRTFAHKQIVLLERLNRSLDALRHFWQNHPANRDWEPEYGEPEHHYRM